ncbi:hypothetical protein WR25_20424 [Diploscapter pachys]|uniref:Vacuolar protein sorting-associated protein 8 central domain-containing protein n=1 Tax=Diploscapter pachys TaxID=2018661 RepID=A0A2A2JLM5_9BILA|nr:hypothetical protein WR25_20424 [Diploscapter pachys]
MTESVTSFDDDEWTNGSLDEGLNNISLDDAIDEVGQLDDTPFEDSLLDEQSQSAGGHAAPSSSVAAISNVNHLTYQLDSAIVITKNESISYQLERVRHVVGEAISTAEASTGQVAVATSRGFVLVFNREGRLDRQISPESAQIGSASCVEFSLNNKNLAIGYSKGALKASTVYYVIDNAGQIGKGLLQIVYLSGAQALLTLDSGGSVYEIQLKRKITGARTYAMRCVFSGCNGEVLQMRLLPNGILALLTVTKVLFVSTRYGGSVLLVVPLGMFLECPPLLCHRERMIGKQKYLFVCICRGERISMFRVDSRKFGTRQKAAQLIRSLSMPSPLCSLAWLSDSLITGFDLQGCCWQLNPDRGPVQRASDVSAQLVFCSSEYKGLATGGGVSEAMQLLAENVAYETVKTGWDSKTVWLIQEGHIDMVRKRTQHEQLDLFVQRKDYISACLYLLDVVKNKIPSEEQFKHQAKPLLLDFVRQILGQCMDSTDNNNSTQKVTHYKKYIGALMHICLIGKLYHIFYNEVWPKLESEPLARTVFFELLDEYILDDLVTSPPPQLISEYITYLVSEGQLSQLQAAVVHLPIECLDLHQIMSTCRQNGLYDGIIYVMNKALLDYISPLEELLEVVGSFASNDVLSDSQVEQGNRLLLYLHCCLAGRAYPFGALSKELIASVPLETYRCMTSLHGKNGSSTSIKYPYLRVLLHFDAQQFFHVIFTCSDAELLQADFRLQQLLEILGNLVCELRHPSALVHLLLLISQLTDAGHITPSVDMVQDAITSLLSVGCLDETGEMAVVNAMRRVHQLNRQHILKQATNPFRPRICSYIYLSERKYVDLLNCYPMKPGHEEILELIRDILQSRNLTESEQQQFSNAVKGLLPSLANIDMNRTAQLVLDYFQDSLRDLKDRYFNQHEENSYKILRAAFEIRMERREMNLSTNEELDEQLFCAVFDGIARGKEIDKDDILLGLLLYWLPLGSSSDFCLNVASEFNCPLSSCRLLEARGQLERAFQLLFQEMEKNKQDEQRMLSLMDEILHLCCRHSSSPISKQWLMKVFKCLTSKENLQSQDMDSRLQNLCIRILNNGAEHASDLFDCLLQYPSFSQSTYKLVFIVITFYLKLLFRGTFKIILKIYLTTITILGKRLRS